MVGGNGEINTQVSCQTFPHMAVETQPHPNHSGWLPVPYDVLDKQVTNPALAPVQFL